MTTQDDKYPPTTDSIEYESGVVNRRIYPGTASVRSPEKPLKVYGTLDDVLRAAVKEKPSAAK